MPDLLFHTLRFDSLPSTNLEAARRASEGASEGLCIVASEQTAGRGRLGRQWISHRGAGLYFSVVLRPQFDESLWPLITLMTSIAVRDALVESCGLQTDIKWPNDLLHDARKLCGILAETVDTTSGKALIVGIGINLLADSLPPELTTTATSAAAATNREPDLEKVLEILQRCFRSRYAELSERTGPERIVREWSQLSSYARDKSIWVLEANESFAGITRGLEPDGALRVETEGGVIRTVRAGDVSIRGAK